MVRGSSSRCRRAFPHHSCGGCLRRCVGIGDGADTHHFASSITSESMTAVWVARERGLFKKHGLNMQSIAMPRSPLAIAAKK